MPPELGRAHLRFNLDARMGVMGRVRFHWEFWVDGRGLVPLQRGFRAELVRLFQGGIGEFVLENGLNSLDAVLGHYAIVRICATKLSIQKNPLRPECFQPQQSFPPR